MHAVRVYRYIKGETMNNVIVNSEISTDFGAYVGNLTSILKVIILYLINAYMIFKIIEMKFVL